MPLLVKLNTDDHTRQPGMTHILAAAYATWLAAAGVDGLEISCGTSRYSPWNMCRGDVPVAEILGSLPEAIRESARMKLSPLIGRFDLEEGYNLEAAKSIKPVLGDVPLMTVGGWRTVKKMEEAVEKGYTDFIAMCRPFIREPFLVTMIREGRRTAARCQNCNRCLAALPNNLPVRCYYHGFLNGLATG
jgi:2,4-dienoyl-CoA reductase-like NADH-dependent reductase (Old Yellow Enzyme family)